MNAIEVKHHSHTRSRHSHDQTRPLSGKEKTQDVFFHIFNHLHQNKKQVILTSDKAPVDIIGMEQRLLSRFKWGLSADLQSPDLETRLAILKKKIKQDGIEIPYSVVEYIAYSITSNVRELEGALISLLAQSSFNKKEITIDLAKVLHACKTVNNLADTDKRFKGYISDIEKRLTLT